MYYSTSRSTTRVRVVVILYARVLCIREYAYILYLVLSSIYTTTRRVIHLARLNFSIPQIDQRRHVGHPGIDCLPIVGALAAAYVKLVHDGGDVVKVAAGDLEHLQKG